MSKTSLAVGQRAGHGRVSGGARMSAYQGTETKEELLGRLREHRRLDQIVQGTYWRGGRGCSVGCCTHDPHGGHDQFPARWGIPEHLARLIDGIFERLSEKEAIEWPERIMAAIPVGADLSLVWSRFAVWLLADGEYGVLRHAPDANTSKAIRQVVKCYKRRIQGDEPARDEWGDACVAATVAAADSDGNTYLGAVAARATAEASGVITCVSPAAVISVTTASAAAYHTERYAAAYNTERYAAAQADELARLCAQAPIAEVA